MGAESPGRVEVEEGGVAGGEGIQEQGGGGGSKEVSGSPLAVGFEEEAMVLGGRDEPPRQGPTGGEVVSAEEIEDGVDGGAVEAGRGDEEEAAHQRSGRGSEGWGVKLEAAGRACGVAGLIEEGSGESVEGVVGFGKSGEGGSQGGAVEWGERCQEAVAETVPGVLWLGVGRILSPGEAAELCVGLNLSSRGAQEGPKN